MHGNFVENANFYLLIRMFIYVLYASDTSLMFKEMNFISNALSLRSFSHVICIY